MTDSQDAVLWNSMRKLEKRFPLSTEDKAAVLGLPISVKNLEPGSYIVRDADIAQNCCVLLSGFAYRHKTVGDGARQILSIHIPGDMVDLHNAFLGIADHNVQMLTAGQVALIPAKAVQDVAYSYPAIGRAMLLETLVDGSIFREWIANVGRRDARSRVAHLLCEFAVRLQASGKSEARNYRLPMSQEQIADATGLTPVHVNRMIQSLRRDGLISTDKRSVTIDNWAELAAAGDFSTAYLHPELAEGEPR
ncbi:Crp/Fnr family transcriptional regulator [Sphingomonas faeni]|uniref:Crp/Fnr family transcriptional regulator n=1 Tax=Sphingomonas faeni TaxID=185950 RepID=UPI00278696D6|nr:Crp/Fnr family transcriptional regulator [Sphingomonas faeni]MDQ0840015.1 CRP-like cAMP-binding protein [Sphingomonas faeni]